MTLGEKIRARRTQLKLSQEYVADQLGISRQAVAKWEADKSVPTSANLAELAALFEMRISDFSDDESHTEKQDAGLQKRRNARMLFGRWAAVICINTGWDGYSSGLYADVPLYWLFILLTGMILLCITTRDMEKKHVQGRTEKAVGFLLILSIFILPPLIPAKTAGLKYLLSDTVTAACAVILSLKYWRHIWKVR